MRSRDVREAGFVSLLTAIMLSLLLLAITVSLIGLQVLTLRKSNDSEQSQRAYYAAESGVEDAVAKIKTGLVHQGAEQPNCATDINLGQTPGTVGWSCQTIKFSGSPSDVIKQPDTAITIDPATTGSADRIASMVLMWDQSSPASPSAYFTPPASGLAGGASSWGQRALPLELSVVGYPTVANISVNQVSIQNFLMVPQYNVGAGTVAYQPRATYQVGVGGCAYTGAGCGSDINNPSRAVCTNAGTTDASGTGAYHCRMTITNLASAGTGHLFRLSSRFLGDNGSGSGRFAINFYDAGGNLISVADSTATIDVTGKAGDVYRRVLYKVPIDNAPSAILNYALFSEVGICQDYRVLNDTDASTYGGHCPAGG